MAEENQQPQNPGVNSAQNPPVSASPDVNQSGQPAPPQQPVQTTQQPQNPPTQQVPAQQGQTTVPPASSVQNPPQQPQSPPVQQAPPQQPQSPPAQQAPEQSSPAPPPGPKGGNMIGANMEFIEHEVEKKAPYRSVIKIVDSLIVQAFVAGASDIHMDPEEDNLRVRFRVDGVLHDIFRFPKEIHSEVLTRIKVLSGLRTDEHKAAQDGRMRVSVSEDEFVDVRVSITPTYYGENCVMRLLISRADDFTLEDLGWSQHNLDVIRRAIGKPYGLLLATGPTGSGKTTTLYMVLKELNKPEVSIVTIEDPIEYSLGGIDQIQVNPKTGLTFATGLRSILRQDPNIVMVGEIRDGETANIAVNAAMTGHLVLSTLHTNDAPTTLPRLLDLGVEPFLIASTLNVAIGQRLVRMICEECKVKRILTDAELDALKQSFPPELLKDHRAFYKGEGCVRCGNTGYKSRIGIHEVLEIDEKLRELIMRRANADEIRAAAVESGMITMTEDGFAKAVDGRTTLEEILRVFHE